MTCNHCVMRVQRALADLPGVRKAVVTLEPGQAKVDYDDSASTADAMAAAVVKAGYGASAVG
jgi:copper chaperone CopZ